VLVLGAAVVGIYMGVSGGSSTAEAADTSSEPPARVEPIGKTGLNRVILSPAAAKRLAIETVPVSTAVIDGKRRLVIPYAAVLYDPNGEAWTYTSPKPRTFVRHDIDVALVRGGVAVLAKGPSAGTRILTVGATEVWGVEYGEITED
jgi:hypothetical protein